MHGGLIRIGELSRRTGVSADVIRAWERRYDVLRPERTGANYRLYSSDDVARLRLMAHFVSRNVPPSRAAELVLRAQTDAIDRNPGVPAEEVQRSLAVLRDSLERFDDGPASRVLARLLGLFRPGAVLRDVVLPYLHGVGVRWECGETTIAQEHFASSFLQGWMLGMGRGWGQDGDRRALLACAPGEQHELGLIAFGVILNDLGWRITYLGADVPLSAARAAAAAVEADVVVLSSATEWVFGATARDLDAVAQERPVVVGGAGTAGRSGAVEGVRALPRDPVVAAHALGRLLDDHLSAAGQAIR